LRALPGAIRGTSAGASSLPLIHLAAQSVQQLRLRNDEFNQRDAAALCFQRNFGEPNQPFSNVILLIVLFRTTFRSFLPGWQRVDRHR